MISYETFELLQRWRKFGLNEKEAARKVDVSLPTAQKYWEMDEKEFKARVRAERDRMSGNLCEPYRKEILGHLKENANITVPMIFERLKTHIGEEPPFSMRTLSRFVRQMRQDYSIKKKKIRKKLNVNLDEV